jgi:hypothetical protein
MSKSGIKSLPVTVLEEDAQLLTWAGFAGFKNVPGVYII